MYLIKQRIRAHLFVNFALYKYLIIIIIIMHKSHLDQMYILQQQNLLDLSLLPIIIKVCAYNNSRLLYLPMIIVNHWIQRVGRMECM